MPIKFIATAVSALGLLSVASVAHAGNCAGPDCSMGIQYMPSMAPKFGHMTVSNNNPMGHLRTVDFQRAPNISIMRVHGMAPTASLSDAPVSFSKGCHPQSTQYCRQGGVTAPVRAQQHVLMPAPVKMGQGYDASKFTPRQYGENTFTPGIAHIPTSIVDRSPQNADRALNSGRAVPQPIANGGMAPRPIMMTPRAQPLGYSQQVRIPTTYSGAPAMNQGYINPRMPRLAGAPVPQSNGTYRSTVGSDGTYWEKMSGPTMMGNTMATQVICKRQVRQRVVRPVINVPVPVPTAMPQGCVPQSQAPMGHSRNANSAWTY